MKRIGNTLYDVIDHFTGEMVTYNRATLKKGGVPIQDSDCDSIVYRKLGNEYFIRNFTQITPEMFGSKEGEDNTLAIQKALDFTYNYLGQGTVKCKAITYNISHLYIPTGVNVIGSDMYTNGAASIESGTIWKCNSNAFQKNMVDFIADNSLSFQLGEKTGNQKSQPKIKLSNIQLDADGRTKHCLSIEESWGFALENMKFHNAISYGCVIFDCNNFSVNKCDIHNFLFISNADYNVDGNEISGSSALPALLVDHSSYGIITQNKIYTSPSFDSVRKFNVNSIDGETFYFSNIQNMITSIPDWFISGTANGSVIDNTVSAGQLLLNGVNKNSFRIVTTKGVLTLGNTYRLTGTILLANDSISGSRMIKLTCGNESQVYTTFEITKGVPYNLDFEFTFNPAGYKKTGPLKIIVEPTATQLANDNIVISNLFMSGSIALELDETPVVLDYEPSLLSTANVDKIPHSEAYYIKMISYNSFKLAKSLSDFRQSIFVNLGVIANVASFNVSVPACVLGLIGKLTCDNCISINKIEDIQSNGILLVGAYNNVITGSKVSKANFVNESNLINVTKGSSKNIIDGNVVNNRFEVTPLDKSTKGLVFDKYSGQNIIGTNKVGDLRLIDIEDNFEGTSDNQNIYDSSVLNNTFIYRKRALDFSELPKGIVFEQNINTEVTCDNPCITENEFTILLNNVYFYDNVGDTVLFKQVDMNVSGGQNGRINIKRVAGGKCIYITVNATVVLATDNNTFINNVPYDIAITKDDFGIWSVWRNGELLTSQQASLILDTPISAGTKTYFGTANGCKWSMSRARIFNDCLSNKEIKTLFSGQFLTKNVLHNNKLLDSSGGLGIFSSVTSGVASLENSGIRQTECIKFVHNENNKLALNLSNNERMRISFYAKSDNADLLSIFQGSNTYSIQISQELKKYVVYIEKNGREVNNRSLVFQFSKQGIGNFGGAILQTSGIGFLDNLKVWKGGVPCVVDLDFTQLNSKSTSIQNANQSNALLSVFNLYLYLQEKYWVRTIVADGISNIFSFAHGLGFTPQVITGSPQSTLGIGLYCIYADATNIYIKYQTAPAAGTFYFGVRASK